LAKNHVTQFMRHGVSKNHGNGELLHGTESLHSIKEDEGVPLNGHSKDSKRPLQVDRHGLRQDFHHEPQGLAHFITAI
jgi:hypothetical protein